MASGSAANMGRIPRHSQLRTHQRRLRHVLRLLVRNVCTPIPDYDVCSFSFYFTLSMPGQSDDCLYTSEVVVGSRNPQWSAIHFSNDCEPLKLASTSFDVCFWYSIQSPKGPFNIAWKQTVSIGLMFYAGFMSSNDGKSYPPNTLFVETNDGFYCQSQDMAPVMDDQGYKLRKCFDSTVMFEAAHIKKSCGSDGLARLNGCADKLLRSQTTSLLTQRSLKKCSDTKLHFQDLGHKRHLHLIKILQLKEQILKEKRALEGDNCKLTEAKKEYSSTQLLVAQPLEELQQRVNTLSSYLSYRQSHYGDVKRSSSNRKRIMIHEVASVFPIDLEVVTPMNSKSQCICKVYLPVEVEDMCKFKHSNVSLGLIAHSTTLLTRILGKQLRFPITFFGSQSTIHDEGSPDVPLESREQGFPLYFKKDHKPSFCTAVGMLAHDIYQLRQYGNMMVSSKQKSLLVNLKLLYDKVGAGPGSARLTQPKGKDRMDPFFDVPEAVPEAVEQRPRAPHDQQQPAAVGAGSSSDDRPAYRECTPPGQLGFWAGRMSVVSSSVESDPVPRSGADSEGSGECSLPAQARTGPTVAIPPASFDTKDESGGGSSSTGGVGDSPSSALRDQVEAHQPAQDVKQDTSNVPKAVHLTTGIGSINGTGTEPLSESTEPASDISGGVVWDVDSNQVNN